MRRLLMRMRGGRLYPQFAEVKHTVLGIVVCYVRGHDLPMQFCRRCGAFLP